MAFPWKKVLCPVDFSEPARAALRATVDIARQFDAELTLFHAYELPGYTLPEGSIVASPRMLQELAEQAETHLKEWKRLAEELGARNVATATGVGEPAAEVVDLAKEGQFDLVVVGTHGRTGFRHALLGSVAERVVRRAQCPVLTIHPGAGSKAH